MKPMKRFYVRPCLTTLSPNDPRAVALRAALMTPATDAPGPNFDLPLKADRSKPEPEK